jgi:hypothetical protein
MPINARLKTHSLADCKVLKIKWTFVILETDISIAQGQKQIMNKQIKLQYVGNKYLLDH